MNTRNCLEGIYFNICALLNWDIDPVRVCSLSTTELIDVIGSGLDILKSRELPSITCPKCGKTSFNSNDILNKYCGNCHAFMATVVRNSLTDLFF